MPETETEAPERELDRAGGLASKWEPPSPNGGPARFKIGNLTAQVWKYIYNTEEIAPQYQQCKEAATEGWYIACEGELKTDTFTITKGPKKGQPGHATKFTVYEVTETSPVENGKTPEQVGEIARDMVARVRGNATGGNDIGMESDGSKTSRPDQAYWDQRNRRLEVQWALRTAVMARGPLDDQSSEDAYARTVARLAGRLLAAQDDLAQPAQVGSSSMSSSSDESTQDSQQTTGPGEE